MKRMDERNLRDAFREEPQACHQALMDAARSAREEEPVKKYTLSTAVIAVLLVIAMMAAAAAATSGGLTEWFERFYHAALPKAAQEILTSTEKSMLEAGPVVFTVNELLSDGKLAYLTVQARLKEGAGAIVYPGSGDCFDRIGESNAKTLNHPELNAHSTYLEAAQATGLPLWCVNAWLEVENANLIDFEMCDGTVQEDGGMLLVRMLCFNETYAGDTLPVRVVVQADELDVETLECKAEQRARAVEERSMPIHGVLEERSYQPQADVRLAGSYHLTGIVAQRTCAGVYVSLCMRSDTLITLAEVLDAPAQWRVLDADGNPFPIGMSLSGEWQDGQGNALPVEVAPEEIELETFRFMRMFSMDELPESMIVSDGTVEIPVK